MTKAELAELISREVGISKKEVADVIDVFFDKIKQNLSNGNTVEMRGFGTFGLKVRKARLARNPWTGDKMEVPEHAVVYFKPGKELRQIAENMPVDQVKVQLNRKKRGPQENTGGPAESADGEL